MPLGRNLIVLTALVMAACQSNNSQQQSAAPPPPLKVQATIVKPRTLDDAFNVTGTVLAAEQTDLHPEVSGRVTQLPIREGSSVKSGDLLVKLYDADLQAQLRKLQVQLEIAKKNEQRTLDLLAVHGTSQQEADLAHLQVSNAMADIDVCKSAISKTEIRAPFSGKIGLRNISPGAYVNPTTIVASIREVGQLKLDFEIPEKYSHIVSSGMSIHFTVAGDQTKYQAKVLATEANVNEQSRTLKVRALVQSQTERLVPGSFANVALSFNSRDNALMIPTQALIPQARDKRVILLKDGKAKYVTVVTGFRSNDVVEILSGLSIGDTVITTGLLFVKPDQKVDISSIVQ